MRAQVKQADITRAIKAVENAGWPRGSFKVVVEGAAITVLPIDAEVDDAAALGRRIEEACWSDGRAATLRPS